MHFELFLTQFSLGSDIWHELFCPNFPVLRPEALGLLKFVRILMAQSRRGLHCFSEKTESCALRFPQHHWKPRCVEQTCPRRHADPALCLGHLHVRQSLTTLGPKCPTDDQLVSGFGTSVCFVFENILSHDFFFLIYLFVFGCVGSLLLHAGFSLVAVSGSYSSMRCTGFSSWWLLLLRSTGSRRVGFSSCSTRAQ